MQLHTLLFEIGCEELPPGAIRPLSEALKAASAVVLKDFTLSFKDIETFSSPRRLALLISGLSAKQPSATTVKMGPTLSLAYDSEGAPTAACIGFARSCNLLPEALTIKETPKGQRVVATVTTSGMKAADCLPEILKQIVSRLPLTKPMRWGSGEDRFLRPVRWLTAMLDEVVLEVALWGQSAGAITYGHRFHAPGPIVLSHALDYSKKLREDGFVLADRKDRRTLIETEIQLQAQSVGSVLMDQDLLEEVTDLVEWPVVLTGAFDKAFLAVPPEVLTTAMKKHQKCFSVIGKNKQLAPFFIIVSNIESRNPKAVIAGNERVMHARLSDAAFFYNKDLKKPITELTDRLSQVVFQKNLGSIQDKVTRITKLGAFIANLLQRDPDPVREAASLCKRDLMSDMVGEFPALQGVMGSYYAKHAGVSELVAQAIKDHYHPRFSGDALPDTYVGCCVALADRLDSLIGILGLNKKPTGEKDPFALRRQALGVARILIEKELPLDLFTLLSASREQFKVSLPNLQVVQDAFLFVMDRLKAWYLGSGFPADVFSSVLATGVTDILDFHQRMVAVKRFQSLPESKALSAANKRVRNLLKKVKDTELPERVDVSLLSLEAEKNLAQDLNNKDQRFSDLYQSANYEQALAELSTLRPAIDSFFDEVMVFVDDVSVRNNRLALLKQIRHLFTRVGDLSLLQ